MKFKLGCDPELFVKDNNGNLVSAHRMVPGTKEKPEPVRCGAIQVDGMALEYNIHPAENVNEFVNFNKQVLAQLKERIPKGYEFFINPLADFGSHVIKAQPEEARILGCDPDFNAYTGKLNPAPEVDLPYRSASGHIHIGFTEDKDPMDPTHFMECRLITILLDRYLGVESLAYEPAIAGKTRRRLYGKAGAFRPKSYGLEYRVLSNFWIQNEGYMRWIYSVIEQILNNRNVQLMSLKGIEFTKGPFELVTLTTAMEYPQRLIDNNYFGGYVNRRMIDTCSSLYRRELARKVGSGSDPVNVGRYV